MTTEKLIRVALTREQGGKIRSLSGFRKGQHIPDHSVDAAQKFVNSIANDELQADLDQTFTALRQAFKFKRVEMRVDGPVEGAGSIVTPHCTYSVTVSVNRNDTAEVIWRREVTDIHEPEPIFSPEFAEVFGQTFDSVEFLPPDSIDLKTLIDRIEELDDPRISIDYDREITRCTLTIEGVEGQIRVLPQSFAIVKKSAELPRRLIESYFEIQRILFESHGIPLIAGKTRE